MISNEDLLAFLSNFNRDGYQRDNFDNFLKKVGFKFNIPAIHIAGTNGKGSTAAYLASIYKEQGYNVGLFTSPAISELSDMISVNGIPIDNEKYFFYLRDNKKLFEKFDLSIFEVQTYIALTYFIDAKCDICVIECGMGGETDATNIFTPVLSVITSVSLEHTAYLGRSIGEIAANKAGIIKENIPTLIGNLPEEAINAINLAAKQNDSFIYKVSVPNNILLNDDGHMFGYGTFNDLFIPSFAEYSVDDAALAIEAVQILEEKLHVTERSISDGLRKCIIPIRLEKLCDFPLLFVDGGHNPEAIFSLVDCLEPIANGKKIHTIFCCFKDKNIERMLAALGSVSETITLTTFDNPRARENMDYFLFIDEYEFEENCLEAIANSMSQFPDDLILVTGSFAFAGYIRKMFKEGKIIYAKKEC